MARKPLLVRAPGVRFTLDNRTGWNTRDLARFFARGLRALRARGKRHIIVVASPIRSRGCAEIGERFGDRLREGEAIVISIASPAKFSLRRLARLFEHEVTHTLGYEHEQMPERILWSEGGIPSWAKTPLRYEGRAPRQIER